MSIMAEVRGPREYEYPLPPEVTIVFKKKLKDKVEIDRLGDQVPEGASPLELSGNIKYYEIKTTQGFRGTIKIRILAPASTFETQGQIFEWTGSGERAHWEDRTLYSVNVGKNKLVVGVIDHLSGFGIRT